MSTPTSCPHCGRTNDQHAGPDREALPADGDVSLCWGCGGIGLFQVTALGLTVRKPTADEQAELDQDPGIRAARAAMAESYTPSQASELRWGR